MADIYCFVCGFKISEDEFFLDTKRIFPDELKFYMCHCCGFHYGADDGYIKLLDHRNEWIEEGMPFNVNLIPTDRNWTLESVIEQLKNLQKCDFSIFSKNDTSWENRIKEYNKDWKYDFDQEKIKQHWFKFRGE
jgi:hypothetical protein